GAGRNIEVAITTALTTCGKAIFFTASLMTLGIAPWYFLSELRFLDDMGLLLASVMLINMVLALLLVPLLTYLFRPRFLERALSALSERYDDDGSDEVRIPVAGM